MVELYLTIARFHAEQSQKESSYNVRKDSACCSACDRREHCRRQASSDSKNSHRNAPCLSDYPCYLRPQRHSEVGRRLGRAASPTRHSAVPPRLVRSSVQPAAAEVAAPH